MATTQLRSKKAFVTPVQKKNKEMIYNYRGISISPIIGKIDKIGPSKGCNHREDSSHAVWLHGG